MDAGGVGPFERLKGRRKLDREGGVVEQVLRRGRVSVLKERIGYLILWTVVG